MQISQVKDLKDVFRQGEDKRTLVTLQIYHDKFMPKTYIF